ncbi:MAG: hypothetical protein KBD47_02675 [Candidatus Pacebacteria bacterium]|nr:hypothetical protein [Candidatus Paceibacterota bacterium]
MTLNPHTADKMKLEEEIRHLESEVHTVESELKNAQREYGKDREAVLEDEAKVRTLEARFAQTKGELLRKKADKEVVTRLEREADKK